MNRILHKSPGLQLGSDGFLEIYIQNTNPGPRKTSNWLPAPVGPFFFVARLYGPNSAVLEGKWQLPSLVDLK